MATRRAASRRPLRDNLEASTASRAPRRSGPAPIARLPGNAQRSPHSVCPATLSPRPSTRTNHGSGSCSYSRVVLERRIRNYPAAQAVGHMEPGLAHRPGGRCAGDHQFRRHPEPGLPARWAQQPSQNRRRHLAAGPLFAAANRAPAGTLQVRFYCPEQSSDPQGPGDSPNSRGPPFLQTAPWTPGPGCPRALGASARLLRLPEKLDFPQTGPQPLPGPTLRNPRSLGSPNAFRPGSFLGESGIPTSNPRILRIPQAL